MSRREEAVRLAAREALKSVETFRLGAVLLADGGRVVARGRNRNANACGLKSIHAEMDAVFKAAVVKALSTRGLHLVVARVLRDGCTTGCSRPCDACARALARRGIGKVTYTTGDPAAPIATIAV